jgi:hypothetical protein
MASYARRRAMYTATSSRVEATDIESEPTIGDNAGVVDRGRLEPHGEPAIQERVVRGLDVG